jgi:hypothetical protein
MTKRVVAAAFGRVLRTTEGDSVIILVCTLLAGVCPCGPCPGIVAVRRGLRGMCNRRDRSFDARARRLCARARLCPVAMPSGLRPELERHRRLLLGPGLGTPRWKYGPLARPSLPSVRCCLGVCGRSCGALPFGRFLVASPEGSACEGEAVACHVSHTQNRPSPSPLSRILGPLVQCTPLFRRRNCV